MSRPSLRRELHLTALHLELLALVLLAFELLAFQLLALILLALVLLALVLLARRLVEADQHALSALRGGPDRHILRVRRRRYAERQAQHRDRGGQRDRFFRIVRHDRLLTARPELRDAGASVLPEARVL